MTRCPRRTSNIRSSLVESPDLPKAPRPPPAIPFNTLALTPFPPAPAALSSPPSSLPSPPPAPLRRALAPAAFGVILRNPPLCRSGEEEVEEAAPVVLVAALLALPDEVPPFSCRSFAPPLKSPAPLPLATPPPIAPAPAPAEGSRMMIFALPPPGFATPPEDPPPAAADVAATAGATPLPATEVAAAATGAPRLLRAVSPWRCRFNRSSRIYATKKAKKKTRQTGVSTYLGSAQTLVWYVHTQTQGGGTHDLGLLLLWSW